MLAHRPQNEIGLGWPHAQGVAVLVQNVDFVDAEDLVGAGDAEPGRRQQVQARDGERVEGGRVAGRWGAGVDRCVQHAGDLRACIITRRVLRRPLPRLRGTGRRLGRRVGGRVRPLRSGGRGGRPALDDDLSQVGVQQPAEVFDIAELHDECAAVQPLAETQDLPQLRTGVVEV